MTIYLREVFFIGLLLLVFVGGFVTATVTELLVDVVTPEFCFVLGLILVCFFAGVKFNDGDVSVFEGNLELDNLVAKFLAIDVLDHDNVREIEALGETELQSEVLVEDNVGIE